MSGKILYETLSDRAGELAEMCGLELREARSQVELLLAEALRCKPADVRARGRERVALPPAFEEMLARRLSGEPVQYILGEQEFMGFTFFVDARVLIPRMDTEVLCERALAAIARDGSARVLDIGTGSGALAVSIARLRPNAAVTGVDISEDALELARRNARHTLVGDGQVRFLRSDCFSALAGERFDVIVSNPPYIRRAELAELPGDVRREPRLALDGGEDGLDFYRRIAREAPEYLAPGGRLLVEVGVGQAGAVAQMFAKTIGKAEIFEDLQGIQRVVQAALHKTEFERG